MNSEQSTVCFEHDIRFFSDAGLENLPVFPYVVEETRRVKKPFSYQTSQLRRYDFAIAVLLFDGAIHYQFDSGDDFILTKGQLMLVAPEIPHRFESFSTGGSYHKLVVEFKGFAVRETFRRAGVENFRISTRGAQEFKNRIMALRDMFSPADSREKTRAIGAGLELLHLMLNYQLLGREISETLIKARGELERPDCRPVGEIARGLGVSRSWLDREFQQAIGMLPSQYRRKYKLDSAKIMLSETDMSIKEIAYRIGYCNQFHFANEFKQAFGLAPRDLRSKPNNPTETPKMIKK